MHAIREILRKTEDFSSHLKSSIKKSSSKVNTPVIQAVYIPALSKDASTFRKQATKRT